MRRHRFKVILVYTVSSGMGCRGRLCLRGEKKREKMHRERGREKRREEDMGEEQEEGGERKEQKGR